MANADTLHDALTSRNNGAQGTGFRTEHKLQKTYVMVHVHEGVLMTKDLRYVSLMGQVRPHGHHAGVKHAMEFCLYNNAVVAALAAHVAGAKKVLIVDWVLFIVSSASHITALEDISMRLSLHRHESGQFYPGN
nr:histone deacetylase 15 [Tanacetum cinerariifolium]GEZ95873.1 histone deacetylase 15 [Tanacetum cinerariifolium]